MPTRRRRRYPELPQKGRFSGFGRGLASFMGDMGQAFGFNILNQAAEERMREFQAAESEKQRELEREGLDIEQRRVDALDVQNLVNRRAQDLTEQTKQRDQLFAQLSPDIKRGNWQAVHRILGDPVAAHLTGGAGQDVDLLANPLQPLGGEDTGAGLVGPFDDDPQGWYDLIQEYDTRDPRYIAQHIANLGEQYGLPIDERGRPTQPELGKAGMTLADIPREAIDQYAADVQFQSVTPGLSGWIHGAPAPDEAAMVGDRATRLGGDPMPDFADTLAAYQEPIEHSRGRMLEELEKVGELPLTKFESAQLAEEARRTNVYMAQVEATEKRLAQTEATSSPIAPYGTVGPPDLDEVAPSVAMIVQVENDGIEFGMPMVISPAAANQDRLARSSMSLSPGGALPPHQAPLPKVVFETQNGRLGPDEAMLQYALRKEALIERTRLQIQALQADPERQGGFGSPQYDEVLMALQKTIANARESIRRSEKFYQRYSDPRQVMDFNTIIAQ